MQRCTGEAEERMYTVYMALCDTRYTVKHHEVSYIYSKTALERMCAGNVLYSIYITADKINFVALDNWAFPNEIVFHLDLFIKIVA